MANVPSTKKNIRKNRRQAKVNLRWKLAAKKALKEAVQDLSSKEKVTQAQKILAKAATHGGWHPNKAARLTSRFMKKASKK